MSQQAVSPSSATPLRYDPAIEEIDPAEAAVASDLMATMRSIQETTYRDYGHAIRSVHAKSHALLEGTLTVLDGLPPALRQGLFAEPGARPCVLRLSTIPGDVLDDAVSTPRGVAIKVLEVEGERLEGAKDSASQDFVMVNGPTFSAPGPKIFAQNLKLLAATTDTGHGWKKAFSAALRGVENAAEAVGVQSSMLKTLGGQPAIHPLGETFYSQTPFRYGEHVAKFSLAPVSAELTALIDKPVDLSGRPNALREETIAFFRRHGGVWELRVQLRTDAEAMPIEDASVEWSQDRSPFIPVARLEVAAQPAWSEARAKEVDDAMAFSVWNGLEAHRPLGAVNRARKNAYREAARFRLARNGCPMREPQGRVALSGAPAHAYGADQGREGRRRGALTKPQPPLPPRKRALAGALGGLAAGILTSAALAGMAGRGPSELVTLQRRSANMLGWRQRASWRDSTATEGAVAHGGHLTLSVISGALYGLFKPKAASPTAAGAAFGLGFYALTYGLLAPALGLVKPPTRAPRAYNLQHAGLHVLFGLVTAWAAARVERKL